MKKGYALLNLISAIAIIYWNYYTAINGLNGNDVGEVSNRYDTLFTPAAYAFSIWGIIFLGMLAFGFYQVFMAFTNKEEAFIEQAGPWFAVANVFNGLWVWFWLNLKTELTILFMVGILISLIMVILNTNMQTKEAPLHTKLFQWIPVSLYAGWISVATIANIAAVGVKNNWVESLAGQKLWAITLIGIATFVNLLMIRQRNMHVFAAVGVWALVAIAVKQWELNPTVGWAATGCAVALAVTIVGHAVKNATSQKSAN